MTYTYSDIAKTIDHSLLPPVRTTAELRAGCLLARRYQVARFAFFHAHCRAASSCLAAESSPATIGVSHGGHTTAEKLAETEQALRDG